MRKAFYGLLQDVLVLVRETNALENLLRAATFTLAACHRNAITPEEYDWEE